MRFLITLILTISYLTSIAQEKSRIVFFRMDADIGENSKSFWEGRWYADDLFHNDTLIGKMKSTSVFFVDAENVAGSYYLVPRVSSKQQANRIQINPPAHSITFVKIRLTPSTPISSYSEVLSLDEFQECYDHAKWLRKELADVGYQSVKELVGNYNISNKDSIQPPSNIVNYRKVRRTLNDTAWIDKYESATNRKNAYIYSVVKEEKPGYYSVNDYFVEGNKLKSSGHYDNLDSQAKTGTFLHYSKKGRLRLKEYYDNNKASGTWESYYDTLAGPIWTTTKYDNDAHEHLITVYYQDGKIKQTELHRTFYDTTFLSGRKHRVKSIYRRDSIMEGHRYDEAGTEIRFSPFERMPKPGYDYNQFLASNIHYPSSALKNNIQGRVIVRFSVEDDGTISDVLVLRGVEQSIDNEAVRVVSIFPPWQPGYQDDKPVKVVFTLPIQFKLR